MNSYQLIIGLSLAIPNSLKVPIRIFVPVLAMVKIWEVDLSKDELYADAWVIDKKIWLEWIQCIMHEKSQPNQLK
ncbi:MAG: hypothetical protein AAFV71_03735 [Cyanobacteria bacterium J06633_8]